MQPITPRPIKQQITYGQLPLAVYREIVAHLRQIDGVSAVLIAYSSEDEQKQQFDYAQSQIKGLSIEYSDNLDTQSKKRIAEIIDYYAQRYYPWQKLDS